ncbi:hypothetical protein BOTBODRAFT_80961, partial [Botryobasidium botryosum FD-172 SS1]
IHQWLSESTMPEGISSDDSAKLKRQSKAYFAFDDELWLHAKPYPTKIILELKERIELLAFAHNSSLHRGIFPTTKTLAQRVFWPSLAADVRKWIEACPECQKYARTGNQALSIPQVPNSLFTQIYLDALRMPPGAGFIYLVLARDALTGWVEGKPFKHLTSES